MNRQTIKKGRRLNDKSTAFFLKLLSLDLNQGPSD